MGFFSMSTKFVEVMLGVKYRNTDGDSKISGGPMYYLRDAFAKKGWTRLGKGMGTFYAICAVLGTIGAASLFQTNQVFRQVVNITGGEASVMSDKGWLFGLFMVFLVGLVIVGGIKSIARVTSKIVPLMGIVYLGAGLLVIAMFYHCLLYTSPSPRDQRGSRMPSSA